MRYHKSHRLFAVCGAKTDPALCDALYDGEHSVIVATDGHAIAIVPVYGDEQNETCRIPADSLKTAVKGDKEASAHIETERREDDEVDVVVHMDDDARELRRSAGVSFPGWRATVDSIDSKQSAVRLELGRGGAIKVGEE